MGNISAYLKHGYDYEGRFGSYWHQIKEILTVSPKGVILEVGPGNNFLSNYLSKIGVKVDTLDTTSISTPTYLGNVTSIPCRDDQYDCVVGFEILEHLPFVDFKIGLKEMARVSKSHVIISIPDVRWFVSVDIRLFSSTKYVRCIWSFPRLINRHLRPAKDAIDHHWEIGRPDININNIIKEINDIQLLLEKHYRVPSNPIHHIFVLKKLIT